MANTLNKIYLLGNLVLEPELKKTTTDLSVSDNRIAVKRKFVKEGGVDTDFFNILLLKHNADYLCRYFHKGDRVLVSGELHNEEYQDPQGNKRYTTKIVVDEIISFKDRSDAQRQAPTGVPTYQQNKPVEPSFEQLRSDDDLPF